MTSLLIKTKNKEDRKVEIDRLVMTIGFGPDCDIDLDSEMIPARIGMFIKKGQEISFKPLLSDGSLTYEEEAISSMISLSRDRLLSYADYQFGIINDAPVSRTLPPMPLTIPEINPKSKSSFSNPAAAIRAYAAPSISFSKTEKKNKNLENIKISDQAQKELSNIKSIVEDTNEKTETALSSKTEPVKNVNEKCKPEELKQILRVVLHDLKSPFLIKNSKKRKEVLEENILKAIHSFNLSQNLIENTLSKICKEIQSIKPFVKLLHIEDLNAIECKGNFITTHSEDGSIAHKKQLFFNEAHALWAFQSLLEKHDVHVSEKSFQCILDKWFIKAWVNKQEQSVISFQAYNTKPRAHRLTKIDQQFSQSILNKSNILLLNNESENTFFNLTSRLKKSFKNTTILYCSWGLLKSNVKNLYSADIHFITAHSIEEAFKYLAIDGLIQCVISDDSICNDYSLLLKQLSTHRMNWIQILNMESLEEAYSKLSLSIQLNLPNCSDALASKIIHSAFPNTYHLEEDQLTEIKNESENQDLK